MSELTALISSTGFYKKMRVEPFSELHPHCALLILETYNQVTRSAGRM